MAKIILLTGSIVSYAYAMEFFIAWYSGSQYEKYTFYNRVFGPYWWYWWVGMLFCNFVAPQLFWFKKFRFNIYVVYFVCMCVNAGMWFERFIIIVGGLHRDFLPSSWGMFYPTWVDIWTFIGTFGIFMSLFLLFIRFLPMIAMSEVKIVLPEADPHHHATPEEHHVVQAGGSERT
jgi:molybdopterin-containing oxidoreductase family membrane subunit